MTDAIEQQLRFHLQRKLMILNGKGQITVRRLVKSIWHRQELGLKCIEHPQQRNRRFLYNLAAQLCEEAGGEVVSKAYCRHNHAGSVASRVYQF